ncbi:hypothetical protein DVH24_001710 [Malus domestica]|uniref:Uncharacterized protein n=1 Tax=Malus domestica TaxID=3750 RepID=A0A498I7K0_MALDO|nr:hypothetical protein DVH24_001710 [Malus domestica]
MPPVESIIAPLETQLKLAAGGILLFYNMTPLILMTTQHLTGLLNPRRLLCLRPRELIRLLGQKHPWLTICM